MRQTGKILAVAQGDRVIVMYEADGRGELTRTRQLDAATGQRVMRALCDPLVRELVRAGDEIEYPCSGTTGLAWRRFR